MPLKIGLDLDGVTFSFVEPFMVYYNNKNGTSFTMKDLTSYRWYDCLEGVTEELFYSTLRDFDASGGWKRCPAYPGAIEALRKASMAGHSFYVISARTGDGMPAAKKVLDAAGIAVVDYHSKTEAGDTKARAAYRFAVDLHIEDRPDECEDVASVGIPVLMVTHNYNKDWKVPCHLPIKRVKSLVDALETMSSFVRSVGMKSQKAT